VKNANMIIKFLPWILVCICQFFLLNSKGNYLEAMYTPVAFFLSITDPSYKDYRCDTADEKGFNVII
jgi:hypothetical protein